jgi:ammonia channel protein AmtB
VAVLLAVILPMTYGLNRLVNRFYPLKAAPEAEADGLDLYELGAEAYPEFTTHREHFRQRT